ncbi:uncharacterized protein [Apostichopus japonicus]|uniref:uncharacterized protein n=1 Tax=Stichopus japonicus TaxID=307972 RepID=UPI003AB4DD6E
MNDLGINFVLESLDEVSPTPSPSNRFKELSSQDIDKIAEGKNEKATLYNTTWGVKLFKEWCTAKGKESNFEVLPPEELNCLLRVFYAEFVGLRAAIHRHLTGEPFCRQINIMSDREFQGANDVFRGVLKQMKKAGLDRSQHKSPIAAADLKKMTTALLWKHHKVPVGKNMLGNMMKDISKAANLSKLYTNHCIRATVITELSNSGFDSRTISTSSGHRCKASIRSYCTDSSTAQKRSMSATLSRCFNEEPKRKASNVDTNRRNLVAKPNNNVCTTTTTSSNDMTDQGLGLAIFQTRNNTAVTTSTNLSNNGARNLFQNCSFSGPVNIYLNGSSTDQG